MNRLAGWIGSSVAALALGLPVAARAADAAHGKILAQRWCASCHAVAPGAKRATDQVPSFAAIANRKDISAERLEAWLQTPHPNMPNFDLARQNIDDLVAYLRSLAKKK